MMARYIITIDVMPQRNDPSGKRRLRMMLKSLWRAWSMRCVTVKPETTPGAKPEASEGQA